MTKTELSALRRLAAAGGQPVSYFDIPDSRGHLPSGRRGVTERALIRLRERGLVTGEDGGMWRITAAGLAALESED